jgi:hypothetical protein
MTTTKDTDDRYHNADGTDHDWLAEHVRSEPGLKYLEAI